MATGSKKVIYVALLGNLLIAITKFVAAAYTGSSAMLSEGIHSLVDTGNGGLLLYGMRRAKRPPDKRFPFGHGKEIYFWSFVVALLIFSLGAGFSIYEGVRHLQEPNEIDNPLVNYVVLGVSMLFEGGAWLVALKEFRLQKGKQGYLEAVEAGKDPTAFAVLLEDSAALLGLLVAMTGLALSQLTGNMIFDGGASIVIGLILASTAVILARETKGLLIGESASQEVVEGIRELVEKMPGVDRTNEILTMHVGPDYVLVNISLMLSSKLDRAQAHEIFDLIDAQIKSRYSRIKRVFIESETRLSPRDVA
ncbi:cation diffusion facilitator family transporter [Massilia soli]|uniref:Cation diffusion facilitator family transporter n=1 Tax=Massilia soli TaxID=2792854 RepID=A0ABS7SHF7_9BURK|nr:cation diffusion facilitator family transporter [Massilia soli]MBZ2205663.1 cation diffusion facilitator family transporter [Massilia soli]